MHPLCSENFSFPQFPAPKCGWLRDTVRAQLKPFPDAATRYRNVRFSLVRRLSRRKPRTKRTRCPGALVPFQLFATICDKRHSKPLVKV